MELLKTKDAASVMLFDLRLSESELECFAVAMNYLIRNLTDEQLHAEFNDETTRDLETPQETRQFLSERYKDLLVLLQQYCYPQYLPRRFRSEENGL